MTQPSAPGWYPDPSGQGQRYWDGSVWGPPSPNTAKPAKRKRRWPWIVAGVIGFLIVVSAVSGKNDQKPSTPAAPSAGGPSSAPAAAPTQSTPAQPAVTYEIESDGPLSSVTYFDAINDEKQSTDVASPWTMTLTNTATYPIIGLGAQTQGTTVTCRIKVNGQVKDEKTATGRYAVVNCNTTAS